MHTERQPAAPECGAVTETSASQRSQALPLVVLVESDPLARTALQRIAQREGFAVDMASTIEDARHHLVPGRPQLVVADVDVPDGSGLELVRRLLDATSVDVVVTTGHASTEAAVDALRLGVLDYVTWPVDATHMRRVFANLRRHFQLRADVSLLHAELRHLEGLGRLIGVSPAMQRVHDLLRRVGPTDAPVLLTGETGTGKELAAMTVHDLSRRHDKPFLAVNCGAVPSTMIESELFGHERGSFTGALARHSGYFERAAGGTLFLDEISEMPPELQVRLLRVLESGRFVRVGGEKEVPVDVRVIAATNRDPDLAIAEGRLRDDLYYRLSVVRLALPPLRERGDDIRLLAEHFLRLSNGECADPKTLTPAAVHALCGHPWPGNVRELKNVIQSAFIMAERRITPTDLALTRRPVAHTAEPPPAGHAIESGAPDPLLLEGPAPAAPLQIRIGSTAADAERQLIMATLAQCGGRKKVAADVLHMSLKTMYNRLRSYRGSVSERLNRPPAQPGAFQR